MQRTRLNTLAEITSTQASEFFRNPWRRISLTLLTFLLGFFVGAAVATTAGQNAQWDVVGAALILIFAEAVSRWVYGRSGRLEQGPSFVLDILNYFKMGILYSLFLEAFKLGS
ncbi:DUF565 domain-containing protein [Synechocystis sp. LKSZ1]|uniref:DUF565 domain-containing protein n=1 Tax=Synechocystis sp. LKSZ1 TaxID=3144951 RepID=UPI00336BD849